MRVSRKHGVSKEKTLFCQASQSAIWSSFLALALLDTSTAWLTHRLLEAVGQPTVAQHSQHRGRWILQILKSIHEDKIQHNIKETHAHHLSESRAVCKGNRFTEKKRWTLKQQNSVCHQHRKLCSFSSLAKPQTGAGQGASNSRVQETSSQKGKQISELHTLACAL